MPRRKQRKSRNGTQANSLNHAKNLMGAVRDDLDALQRDVRGLVSDVGSVATEEVRGAMHGAVERIETWSHDNIEGFRDVVRSQPIKACALSIGAGALIGALLLR